MEGHEIKSIYLAYDGSVNGDWISKYAVELSDSAGASLKVVYVRDNNSNEDGLNEKVKTFEKICKKRKIKFVFIKLEKISSVFNTILHFVPGGKNNLLICGTRVREKKSGFISGTTSEELLRSGKFSVLAIRVVHPGILGSPGEILLAASGNPRVATESINFVSLFLEKANVLHIVRIMEIGTLFSRYISLRRSRMLRKKGMLYVKKIASEIRENLKPETIHLDSRVEISDDWAREILVQAGKLKSQLLLLGASPSSFSRNIFYRNRIEKLLRDTPCDVGIYKSCGD